MAIVVQENDVFLARLEFRDINGHYAYNTLHYRVSSIVPAQGTVYQGEAMSAVGPQFAISLYNHLHTDWAPLASQQVGFTSSMVQNIWPLPVSRQYHFVPGVATAGAVNEDALPLQDTPTLVKRTALGSRNGVGRMFVVGLPEGANATGFIVNGYDTLLGDFAKVLDDVIPVVVNGITFNMKPVLAAKHPTQPNTMVVNDIMSIALSGNTFKTQRRRRPGKGI